MDKGTSLRDRATREPSPDGLGHSASVPSAGTQASNLDPAHDALNRMARAHARGTGCHLTAVMLDALYRTSIGEMWSTEDPRDGKFYGRRPASAVRQDAPDHPQGDT